MEAIKIRSKRIILLVIVIALIVSISNVQVGFATDDQKEDEQPSQEPIKIALVDGKECVDGEVLVKFSDNKTDSSINYTLESFDSTPQNEPVDNLIVTQVPEGETIDEFIGDLETQANIEYVQPNYIYRLDRTVDDPFAQLPNPYQWHLDNINAYEAWDITMGSPDIKVAVLDTGIDLSHPDLRGQVFANVDMVDNDGIADDDNGHGTHVAGIIAAKANNGIGVAGIAPGVKLVVVDVFGWHIIEVRPGVYENDFFASTEDIVEGINYAIDSGTRVINMSFGDYESDSAIKAAINNAVSVNIVCVASAGNNNRDNNHYPSDHEACISVIWLNEDNTKGAMSNYGDKKDISAPGGTQTQDSNYNFVYGRGILSTYYDPNTGLSTYEEGYGTSAASPIVAGTVALMLSVNPGLTVDEVKAHLYNTATDLGWPGKDENFGYGLVNTYLAVLLANGAIFDQGDGTEANPFLVSTPRQLNEVRYYPNSHFKMTNDIDMSQATSAGGDYYNEGKGWKPIFKLDGVFDGDGFCIYGLKVEDSVLELGLFRHIEESGTVKNLYMSNYTIIQHRDGEVGAIAVRNYGLIQNCYVDGYVFSEEGIAGGIVGSNYKDIINCSSDGVVEHSGQSGYSGGISGMNRQSTLVDSCTNYAEILGGGGGITAYNDHCTIVRCNNFGNITGETSNGGIAGINRKGLIENCYNAGTVGLKDYETSFSNGGIVGYNWEGTVLNCFNIGNSFAENFGSIVGKLETYSYITNCYNADYQTYNIVHENNLGTISNSYFLYDGSEDLGAEAKTSIELKQQETYESYDFDNVWSIVEGERFAVLQGIPFVYTTGFSFEEESMEISVNQEKSIRTQILPLDATNKCMFGTSENEDVATIKNGIITGVSEGTTTIAVTTADGGFSDNCSVTVIFTDVSGVSLDKEDMNLSVTHTDSLNATIMPANASNKTVTWSSDDESVATVVDGVVTGISVGTTAITVETEDGGYTATCAVTVEEIYTDTVIDGELNRTYFNKDGSINRVAIYYGANDSTGIWKINYYEDGFWTSYEEYDTSGNITTDTYLYSNGVKRKTYWYSAETGKRYAISYYGTNGKITHKKYLYSSGVTRKTYWYSSKTGKRYSISEYNTSGEITSKTYLYLSGVKKRTYWYSTETGKQYAISEYNTSGKITEKTYFYSSGVKRKTYWYSTSTGKRYAISYYGTNGKITQKTYLYSSGVKRKNYWYSAETGKRYAISEYNTSGKITSKTYLYSSGVRRKTYWYSTSTGKRYAISYYDTNGKITQKTYLYSNGVKKKNYWYSEGKRYAISYYDTNGDITKKVYYNSDGSVKETKYY